MKRERKTHTFSLDSNQKQMRLDLSIFAATVEFFLHMKLLYLHQVCAAVEDSEKQDYTYTL